MRPAREISRDGVDDLRKALKESRSKGEYQRIQCLWLRSSLGMRSPEIALALGWRETSVRRVQLLFFKDGLGALSGIGRGGRRHENLSREEEKVLLDGFFREAEDGGILEVSRIKVAYEKCVGHPVPKSTVYRMLDRHGWRKIVPRPRHPDADQEAQEAFKKTSPTLSRKPSRSTTPKVSRCD